MRYIECRRDLIKCFNSAFLNIISDEYYEKIIDILIDFHFEDDDEVVYCVRLLQRSLQIKINIMNLHFNYVPGGEGYLAAKSDFINKLK